MRDAGCTGLGRDEEDPMQENLADTALMCHQEAQAVPCFLVTKLSAAAYSKQDAC